MEMATSEPQHDIEVQTQNEPGFWEGYGYHNYGDPWKEQRYWGDD
jgi:DMSO/TMAO reductase YedYZ molybdopterin-dependent catalytic subunit